LAHHKKGASRIAWARENMPILAALRKDFEKTKPLAGQDIAMGLHVESKTAVLAEVLVAGGAELAMTGSPGTTDDAVAAALRKDLGIQVLGEAADTYSQHLEHVDVLAQALPNLLVDNGADLIASTLALPDHRVVAATEETTSGALRLRGQLAASIPFPVLVINDSPMKQLVENEKGIGPAVLDGFMRATNTSIVGKTFCVIGYGSCGRSLAQTLRALDASVIVVEKDPVRAVEAAYAGMLLMDLEEALPKADGVFTITGRPGILLEKHFELFRDRALLANVGHFSTEIDIPALRQLAVKEERLTSQIVDHQLPSGKRIRLLSEGEMLNLAAGTGHAIEVMDVGFALQAYSVRELAGDPSQFVPGDQPVPRPITEAVASSLIGTLSTASWTPS
jgi:adenosylhomocysteinase